MASIGAILHIFNEEMILPFFIAHHVEIFDSVTVIDHHSTDLSWDIVETMAPGWKIVSSCLPDFNAADTDAECMRWEETLTTDWKIVLTATEFIWNHDYVERLEELRKALPGNQAFGGRCIALVDRELNKPLREPLWRNHTYGSFVNKATEVSERWRFAHTASSGLYTPGRHSTRLTNYCSEELLLLHWRYAPYPQSIDRKLKIQTRIPQSDINQGMGTHHIKTAETLDQDYKLWLAESYDLLLDPKYKAIYDERMSMLPGD
jgi:hypothetical protein